MKVVVAILVLVAVFACNRSRDASNGPDTRNPTERGAPSATTMFAVGGAGHLEVRQNPLRDLAIDAGIDIDSRLASDAGFSTQDVDKLLEIVYGDRARHSREELRIIAFVEEYLDRDQPQYPRPRRFLVDREPGGWAVSVLKLEALKKVERMGDLAVHVVEENGKLRVARLTTKS